MFLDELKYLKKTNYIIKKELVGFSHCEYDSFDCSDCACDCACDCDCDCNW